MAISVLENCEPLPPTIAVASAAIQAVLSPEELGEFLALHSDARLICHDAARVHWILDKLLRHPHDKKGLKLLWRFSRRCRLHDVMLLDQRVSLVLDAVYRRPKRLEDLNAGTAQTLSPESSEGVVESADAAQSNEEAAVQIAGTTLAVYRKLLDRAEGIHRGMQIPSKLVAKFGPLGLGIDVQGAIALRFANRNGLLIHMKTAHEAYGAAERLYQESSARLAEDQRARQCFDWQGKGEERCERIRDWEGKTVAKNAEGFPEIREKKLREWLEGVLWKLPDVHVAYRMYPLNDAGRLSSVPCHWGLLARCHPLLRAWANLVNTAESRRWMTSLNDPEAHPRYRVIPQIQSWLPDLEQLRRFGHPLFRPRPGHEFLVGRFTHLELRCWAAVCERRYRPCGVHIAQMFREGGDPVLYTAGQLYAWDVGE